MSYWTGDGDLCLSELFHLNAEQLGEAKGTVTVIAFGKRTRNRIGTACLRYAGAAAALFVMKANL
jgi:site-specific recombinase XerC